MVLLEHQSTYNPNMPLRGLHYFSRLYTKLTEMREYDLYGSTQLALPTPRYVVFYFGSVDRPDREVLRLSDSFTSGPGDLEVTATMLNCNEGRNRFIMEACEALRGYSHLIALERDCRETHKLNAQDAARLAVNRCIEDGVLVDYLMKHRAEVEDMLFTIQDEERAMKVHRKAVEREARGKGEQEGLEIGLAKGLATGHAEGLAEGRAEGRAVGRAEGRAEGLAQGKHEELIANLKSLMESTGCDAESAMDMLMVPQEARGDFTAFL